MHKIDSPAFHPLRFKQTAKPTYLVLKPRSEYKNGARVNKPQLGNANGKR